MITEVGAERLEIFLETLDMEMPSVLKELETEALADAVPVIRRDTQRFLRTLLEMKRPETILEIGTAIGYSSVFFSICTKAGITTIENYPKRICAAREHFRKLGLLERITLLEGDAGDLLPGLTGPYDFIFLDAAQGQYVHFLPELMRLMPSGGVLVTDNVLIGGDLLESRFAVERRKRTIHRRMREYLREIMEREELVTTVIPVGDGLAVTVKR